ncbi:MAG: hypothetical protein QOE54_6756 [Streptosporangiaceae bacterium]|jgi:hypothetical protein|nr:hypothetical protein [Streptosporangiaceae bacterium]MDX6296028.1 hypothetical protein [Kribbellaceae bacterium]MDX6434390.1 hypothetical protein [Streptosporangiaceae bacterium]
MRSVLAYSSARILIFAATCGVLWVTTPMRQSPVLLLAVSILISGIVSYVLLSRQRDRMSSAIVTVASERRRRFEKARTKEDAPD